MKRARVGYRRRPGLGLGLALALALGGALVAIVGVACAPETPPSVKGEECFAATDCATGLVCVPQRSGARLCSDDLSQVTGARPPEGDGGPASGEAGADGPRPIDQDTGTDTGAPDTGIQDAADAG